MTTAPTTTAKPRHRWRQFSLRTMLVLATCVALSWLGLKVRQAGEQRKAVEAIHRLGGTVFYDYLHDWIAPVPPPIFTPTDQPTRPRFVWLANSSEMTCLRMSQRSICVALKSRARPSYKS